MQTISVSDLTAYIKKRFESDELLANVIVKGEISNFKKHTSGHCYFTLKDSKSMIKAVMFRGNAQYLKFMPADGLKAIAKGYVTLFERDGQYQIYVERLTPEGIGELSLAYEQLKKKLGDEGFFAESRKKKLPFMPVAIGIATSPTGAAVRDIFKVAKRRHPGIPLILYPVQVQGEGASEQIVKAINYFNRRSDIDVIIIGRGGGSIEELWAFNSEVVVRSIAMSNIPVVSAVGHETDFTLADFAADKRAATPSQAAELVVPDLNEIKRYIISLKHMLEVSVRHRVMRLRTAVEQSRKRKVLDYPQEMLAGRRQVLDIFSGRLGMAGKNLIGTRRQLFNLNLEKLNTLNPLAVLARGYSVTQTRAKQIVKKACDVTEGQRLQVILSQGIIEVTVNSREGDDYES